ncbi:hypothetical protein VNO80_21235 [Phaseolus coccineus]|uniref:HMA domain-containing protein n=1 Tax=Phaseolus coccineus TaxID=3886 RepID=A0AAN9QSW0_PHACN
MAINNTESEVCMKASTNDNRSLLHMENLTLPPFQVVVIAANMGCNGCRRRVFRVVSRMTGLTEYSVDVRKREVTIKGDFIANCNLQNETIRRRSLLQSASDEPKSLSACLAHSH